MKRNLKISGRFALTSIAAAMLALASPWASALGLGRLTVQSALGEAMVAEIEVTSMTADEQANLKIRVAPPEAYRAASVDYNPVLPTTRATLQKRPDGRLFVRLVSDRGVQEPFVDVILEISWATGRLVREYTLLFDPPTAVRAQAPAAPAGTTTSPVISAAPPPPASLPPALAPSTLAREARESREAAREAARQAARERREAARAAAADKRGSEDSATQSARAAGVGVDEYRVRSGDTLSKIAARTQRSGVSLDQMLVALFRANPSAFSGDNMNRLKAGVVLSVPAAETAQAIGAGEARKTIVAQSADFGAYRQKLAGSTLTPQAQPSARQSTGKVQASVEDRKTATAPTPDKLTLSKGGAAAVPGSAEDRLAKERERQAAEARVAELNKNLTDLKKIQGAAPAASPATPPATAARPAAPAPAPAPAPATAARPAAPAPAPVVVAAAPPPPPAPVPAPAVAPTPAPAPVVAPASAARPSAPASVSAVIGAAPVVPSASGLASGPVAVARPPASAVVASRPVARPPVKPAPVVEPSLIDTLTGNPLYTGVGLLALLLAGFGVYRFTQRSKKDSGETSFLESRLQPDSFFGASGGQRIDTRDAGGSSSSMTYSLSQLDAIGDVDPVAEADVYLAYGRDLQAEEILKEAMRSNPERLAIRSKLLEVYAKRRDIKGFELLATQLFALTRGEGEEWTKAQDLGSQIDPENPLYQAGGAPERHTEGATIAEPLGASTLPQSIIPVPSQYGTSVGGDTGVHDSQVGEIDLDLDDPEVGVPSQPVPFDATESVPPRAGAASGYSQPTHKMPLTSNEPTGSGPDHRDEPLAFDLSGITLDLDKHDAGGAVDAIERPFVEDEKNRDPLSRKLELAEEFQRIGDKDGARDLLREVLATASGATKTKAQGMLDDLS
ncbi:MAG: FimV/HubP family polar landmark protein [Caldimonas sp.]